MNRIYTRTDLASECTAGLDLEKSEAKSRDYSFESTTKSGFDVSVLKILNSSGERVIGKPCGTYVTVNTGKIWHATEERFSAGSELICEYIKKLFETVFVFMANLWRAPPPRARLYFIYFFIVSKFFALPP